ncbi:MAG: hypothetical protein WCV00_05155 [Verrucomicrobiia bacterium]|jgi:hypothetical protein
MKHFVKQHHRLLALCLAGLLGMTEGCVPAKVRLAAVRDVTTLQSELEKEQQANVQVAESLIREVLAQQRSALRSQWRERRLELITEAHVKFAAKLDEQRARLVSDLGKALDPVLGKLKMELEAERAKGATGTERANALALQLSSTLAVAQRETAKAEEEIQKKGNTLRDEHIAAINDRFAKPPPEIEGGPTDAELEAVMKPIREHSDQLKQVFKTNLDSLATYIQTDAPFKLFFQGFLGENLYKLVQPTLTSTMDGLQSKLTAKADDWAKSLRSSLQDKLKTSTTN